MEREVLVLVLSYAWTKISTLGWMSSVGDKQAPKSSWGLWVQYYTSLVRTTGGFLQPDKCSLVPWKEPGKAFSLLRMKRPGGILLLVGRALLSTSHFRCAVSGFCHGHCGCYRNRATNIWRPATPFPPEAQSRMFGSRPLPIRLLLLQLNAAFVISLLACHQAPKGWLGSDLSK